MKKFVFVLMLVLVLALSACGGGKTDSDDTSSGGSTATVPAEYAGKTNPLANDANAATAGKDIYATNCASCHGDTGAGDGPAGSALEPKPAALNNLGTKGDDYLNWRIHEGGAMEPFNSSMPAFKGVLSDEQVWQVIAYIHTLGK